MQMIDRPDWAAESRGAHDRFGGRSRRLVRWGSLWLAGAALVSAPALATDSAADAARVQSVESPDIHAMPPAVQPPRDASAQAVSQTAPLDLPVAAPVAGPDADAHSAVKKLGPLLLVSQSEIDALPLDTPVAWTQKPVSPDGPRIQIESPTNNATYEGPFPIKVQFLPGPKGHDVDLESLKLEYKKAWGIDITDRVRDYISGSVIDVDESELPAGRHTVEIEIADVAKNMSRQIFTVIVK